MVVAAVRAVGGLIYLSEFLCTHSSMYFWNCSAYTTFTVIHNLLIKSILFCILGGKLINSYSIVKFVLVFLFYFPKPHEKNLIPPESLLFIILFPGHVTPAISLVCPKSPPVVTFGDIYPYAASGSPCVNFSSQKSSLFLLCVLLGIAFYWG